MTHPRNAITCLLLGNLILGFVVSADDSITLKTGEIITGSIVSETVSNLEVEIGNESRTIFTRRTVDKVEIGSIQRESVEQKQQRELVQAYQGLQKYQLDPAGSYLLEYYDKTIDDVFRNFLIRYPKSQFEKEITDRIVAWQSERDTVASGKTKVQGKWLETSSASPLIAKSRAGMLLKEGNAYREQGNYEKATERFRAIFSMKLAELEPLQDAKRILDETYEDWLKGLQRQITDTSAEIRIAESNLGRAQRAEADARSAVYRAENELHSGVRRLGQQGNIVFAQQELGRKQNSQVNARSRLDDLQSELYAIRAKLFEIQSANQKAVAEAIQAIRTQQEAVDARRRAEEDARRLAMKEPSWIEKYWMWIAGSLLVGTLWYSIGRIDAWRNG